VLALVALLTVGLVAAPTASALATPKAVTARATSPTSIKVHWTASPGATRYTIRISRTRTGRAVLTKRVPKGHTALRINKLSRAKLKLPRSFFVTVRAYRGKKVARNSRAVAVTLPYPQPAATAAMTLTVGSYNVMKSTKKDRQGRDWAHRVGLLAANIRAMHADIVGVQEATWDLQPGPGIKSPVKALAKGAGLAVAMNPKAPATPCNLHSQHILYRPSAFKLTSCGTKQLHGGSDARFVTWAVLRNHNGSSVFAVNTHLSTGSSHAADKLRATEAKIVIRTIAATNRKHLPVILTGDMNSFYGRATTTPLSLYSSHGLVGADLTARRVSHINSYSAHGFAATKPYGLRIDHILGSADVAALSFAVDVSNYRTAPSDHFPIQARLAIYER